MFYIVMFFLILGILSKSLRFNNVFNYDNQTYYNTKNEIIKAFELGYGYRSKNFSLNLNAYHTIWENKPQSGSTVLDGGKMHLTTSMALILYTKELN